ncbi:hypothetical protein [Pseudomonas sp. MB-090624]|uniref:hypothetical protein n=1 Tax=Pseudomonas sp. MB-090624 TaxID=2213078 RepID=UPI00353210FF
MVLSDLLGRADERAGDLVKAVDIAGRARATGRAVYHGLTQAGRRERALSAR